MHNSNVLLMNWTRFAKLALLVLLVLGATSVAWAHDPGLSTATVRLFPDRLEAILTFALKDAGEIGDLDADNNGQISVEEFEEGKQKLAGVVAGAFDVKFNDELRRSTNTFCQLDENRNVEVHLSVPGKSFTRLSIRSKVISLCPLDHKQYLMLQNPSGVMLDERLLRANSDTVTIEVSAESAPTSETETNTAVTASASATNPVALPSTKPNMVTEAKTVSFLEFLKLGIEHILTGYDHLLFLFALLLVTRDWASSLKVITFFTIAHSITLGVATFDLVSLPSRFVEPMIALSIVYVGVENIVRRGDPHKRWIVTFTFGLIHGFGFASVLKEMGVGARAGGVAMPLFSFNLGVEVGQILVAAIALPIIWKLRKNERFLSYGVPACSVLVAIAGGAWFVMRVMGR
jgi:hydrogenase/urease accessory protein HupE